VEVKGTQTSGTKLIFTRGEVDHINSNPTAILILVHSVNVNNGRIEGGEVAVRKTLELRLEDLQPLQYLWKLPALDH